MKADKLIFLGVIILVSLTIVGCVSSLIGPTGFHAKDGQIKEDALKICKNVCSQDKDCLSECMAEELNKNAGLSSITF